LLMDITDKIENEQRLQLAIEGAREGMWDWDISTNELLFNDYMSEMLGYSADELKPEFNEFLQRMHPDDREPTRIALTNHLKGISDYYEKEYRLKTKSGDWKWILTRGRVVERDAKGWSKRAIGTHIDIDNRKRAEIALSENERMLSTLMSNLPGMVYRCVNDRNWTMVFTSEGAKKLTGYSPEDIVSGKVMYNDLIVPSDRERIWQEVQDAIDNNKPFTISYRIDTPHGIKWIWEQGRAIDENKTLEGFVTDITDRVMAEERLVSTIIQTEDNERRRISKELHDNLGQKLTTVSLNLNALKNDVNEDHKGWKKLDTGLRYLTQAIKDGREIAHNLMPQSIDDFGYVLSVQSMLADIKTVSPIKFEFYDNLNGERLDNNMELHLYRITQEAINNCIKHSEAELVSIQLMKYKNEVVLTIEDDGKGFKFDGQWNASQNFGLKSIYNRIGTLSGNVYIDSTISKGTTITVELPIKMHKPYESENINS
ncbi:MAG: PAS domain-containing protein, partial [Bacteroidota bacterium]